MALESGLNTTATFIDDLDFANPVGATDKKKEGDDHIRGVKRAIKQSFSGITGECSATQAELNTLDGFTGTTADLNLVSGLAAGSLKVDAFPATTAMLFYQNAAPDGWTIVEAVEEHSIRLTKGEADGGGTEDGGTIGGTNTFTAQFVVTNSSSESSHTHTWSDTSSGPSSTTTPESGGGDVVASQSHTHTVSGTTSGGSSHLHTVDLAVKWAACIVATKDA